MIAVVRLRYCRRTRAYAKRRRSEGLSNKEIIRCLKRYIARQPASSIANCALTSPHLPLDYV
jgi:hypothetical protein